MDDEHNPFVWIVVVSAFAVWESFMFSMVFASLNEHGLAYFRWGKWKEISWAEMGYGGAGPIGFISVKLRNRPIWCRYLLLRIPNPPLDDRGSSLPGATRFCEV